MVLRACFFSGRLRLQAKGERCVGSAEESEGEEGRWEGGSIRASCIDLLSAFPTAEDTQYPSETIQASATLALRPPLYLPLLVH